VAGLSPPASSIPVTNTLTEDLAPSQNLRESHLRSILKAFSWRVIATLTTGLIAYAITGEIDTAILIGGIEFALKFVIYYLHERLWQLAPRGSVRHLLRH
jgi:uncharacterized membrane protein